MERQGLRYQARAAYRQEEGAWKEFHCILLAPRRYLESAYPLNNHKDAGWDSLVSLEDLAQLLEPMSTGSADAAVILQSTEATNSWNRPIPEAALFWRDLSKFQLAVYPDVPIFINRQQGAGVFVWPSFYENDCSRNSQRPHRKRVQIVYSAKKHMSLFIKKVKAEDFFGVVQPLLEDSIHVGAPGKTWQSIKIRVPYVDPQKPLETQSEELNEVFGAARRLYDFFIKHEEALLGIPTFK
jgi:hypothetical protein